MSTLRGAFHLSDITFDVNNNDKIAVVGRTGCGKTTLVNLLCKFSSNLLYTSNAKYA